MEHLGRGPVAQGMMGPTLAHSPPSHSSKTVLSTVHVGSLIAALIEGEGKGVDGFGAVEGWCDGVVGAGGVAIHYLLGTLTDHPL